MKHPLPKSATDLKVHIDQDSLLDRLSQVSRPNIPMFYSCGIMAARMGYYQLVEMENKTRLLVYALNLEDMQRRETPMGTLMAHPEKLFGVGAYPARTPGGLIMADLVRHQESFRHCMMEEGTLTRTGPNVFQSRAVSYVVSGAPDANGQCLPPSGKTGEKVHVDAFLAVLPGKEFVPVHHDETAHAKWLHYPRMRITQSGPVEAGNAIFEILHHYNAVQTESAEGRDVTQNRGHDGSASGRLLSSLKVGLTRYHSRLSVSTGQLVSSMVKELEQEDFVVNVGRLAWTTVSSGITTPFTNAAKTLFGGAKTVRRAVAAELQPYVRPGRIDTPLNLYLAPLDTPWIQGARPLSLEESRVRPDNSNVRDLDPFDTEKYSHVGWNSVRAALGTVLLPYDKTLLHVQPNGLWLAVRHDLGRSYVGYNPRMDKTTLPAPSPQVAAWLEPGKVICFQHAGGQQHKYQSSLVPLASALRDLDEIERAGDVHLLVAEKPTHAPVPQVIKAKPNVYTLKFEGALLGTALLRVETPQPSPGPNHEFAP